MTVARASRNMLIHAKTYDNFSVLMEPLKAERLAGTDHLKVNSVSRLKRLDESYGKCF